MKSSTRSLVLNSTLAGLLVIFAAGCNKPADTSGTAPPTTTVGMEIDDSVLTASVKSALLGDESTKSRDIAIVTRKGEVQLSGFVDNQQQIDRAIEITRGIQGVSGVSNEMSIKK